MVNGNVGRSLRRIERRKTDKEFKEKHNKYSRDWQRRNKDKELEKQKKRTLELSKFRNRKCLDCGKLLHYKTESNYCSKHIRKHLKKK